MSGGCTTTSLAPRHHHTNKMKFKAGYLGVAVITLALLGSILSGFLLNVDKDKVTTTGYEYVTDITGLFDFSDTPQYVDYSPASNYTGFKNTIPNPDYPTGLSFTTSTIANNYRVPTYESTPTTGPSGTINNNTSLVQVSNDTVIYANTEEGYGPTGLANNQVPDYYTYVSGYKVATVYHFCQAVFGDNDDYNAVELTFTYPGTSYPVSSAFIVPGLSNVEAPYVYGSTTFYPQITRLVINPDSLTAQAYTGATLKGTYSLYDLYIYYGQATQSTTIYTEDGYGGASTSIQTVTANLSLSYTSVITPVSTYAYLLPSAGVTLASNPLGGYFSTEWDNDTTATPYLNSRVDIVVSVPVGSGLTFGFSNYNITFNNDGGNVSINGTAIGAFNRFVMTIDTVAGTVTVRPIITFENFQSYTMADVSLYSASIQSSNGLTGITIHKANAATAPGYWLVANTSVFMDTYNSVMVDPTIDMSDYFPDLDSYRYWFQSFAIYGDSVTFNGVTYPLDQNHSIEIGGRMERLNNFFLSFDMEDNASVTFNLTGNTYDLGPVVDRVVSFAGVWYFNAGLYEGHLTTEDVYVWAGVFDETPNTVILLGLGVMLVLVLGLYKAGYKFRLLDKLVLALGAFVLLSFIGGF